MTISQKCREIVLDTETTGLDCLRGDRIVDIGCVELINHIQTGKFYHVYLNPERKMTQDAIEISGITDEFLQDKPHFEDVVDEFLNFVGDSHLVIHNAKFDVSFLNSELSRCNKPLFNLEEAIDTLEIAKRKFPGSPASLDALCRRFSIDTSIRSKHGALIDCYLLAEVYLNLLGGLQSGLSFDESNSEDKPSGKAVIREKSQQHYRSFPPEKEELQAHKEFLQTLTNPLWYSVLSESHNREGI